MSIIPGAIRFNTDSMKLEYFRIGTAGIGTLAAGEWVQITTDTPEVQTGGTRGIHAIGAVSPGDRIDYVNIATTGNAQDFGNALYTTSEVMGLASRTRGVFAGGYSLPNHLTNMNFVTISSTGDSINFGDLNLGCYAGQGAGNNVRGIFAPGSKVSYTNIDELQYITIASTGNAIDFGEKGVTGGGSASSSSVRTIFAGGSLSKNISFVTTSTLGNAADFGDLTLNRTACAGCSNSIRSIHMGGSGPASQDTNIIEYISISTLGNAIDFGDLSNRIRSGSAMSSSTRAVSYAGFANESGNTDKIEYVQFASTGNAIDFGNANGPARGGGTFSNGHGGLG